MLFAWLVSILLTIIDAAVFGLSEDGIGPLSSVFALAIFLPYLAVTARRLHDVDRSGWWMLIYLIPLIGWILMLVWSCQRGTPGINRFGADPLAGAMGPGGMVPPTAMPPTPPPMH